MQTTEIPPAFDRTGRALPLPADEEQRRASEAIRGLDALAAMGDDEEQVATFDALIEAIDRDRLSDRNRFVEDARIWDQIVP